MQSLQISALEEAPKSIRVALVSDHQMARAGMAQTIASQPDMSVVGEYDQCRQLVGLVMKTPPDAVILELTAGGGDILDTLTRCRSAAPGLALIIIAHSRDPEIAERAIQAGARGYLYRNVDAHNLITAIRSVINGDLHVCHSIASPMLQKAIYGQGKHKSKHPSLAKLSAREFQIFQLIGSGWNNQKIARELGISIKTHNVHVEHLKQKMLCTTTHEVRQLAICWHAGSELGTNL